MIYPLHLSRCNAQTWLGALQLFLQAKNARHIVANGSLLHRNGKKEKWKCCEGAAEQHHQWDCNIKIAVCAHLRKLEHLMQPTSVVCETPVLCNLMTESNPSASSHY